MRWRQLLTDERGFLNFLLPAASAALGFLRKPGVQAGAQALGGVLGGLAGGRAEGRQNETDNQLRRQQLQQQLFEAVSRNQAAEAQMGAQRAQFERDSPDVRFGQAMRGNLAANMNDVTLQVPDRLKPYMVQFGGGLRPSAIGVGGRAAGQQLADLGADRMGKDTFAGPQFSAPPQMAQLPQANWLDKLLSVAGPAASMIGALPQSKPPVMYGGPTVGRSTAPPPGIQNWRPPSPQMEQPVSGIMQPDLIRSGFGGQLPDWLRRRGAVN